MDKEINLIDLSLHIWKKKNFILKVVLLFLLFGILTAFLTPNEYSVSTTMIPNSTEGSNVGGGLSGLASLAGVNLGASEVSGDLPPTLYPKILRSLPFQLEVLGTIVDSSVEESPISFRDFRLSHGENGFLTQLKKFTIGLPTLLKRRLRNDSNEKEAYLGIENRDDLIRISSLDRELLSELSGRLDLSVDEFDGIITLNVRMPEPIMAAQMAKSAQEKLLTKVIDFRISKAREQLLFTETLYKQKKAEFEKAQEVLSTFRDRNLNITTSTAKNQLERLETNNDLAFNVFSELAKQLENAEIKVKENTPAFTVLDPIVIPLEKSRPKRLLTMITSIVFGFIFSIVFIVGKEIYRSLKKGIVDVSTNASV